MSYYPSYNMTTMYMRARDVDTIREMQARYVEWLNSNVEKHEWWAGGQIKINGKHYTESIYFGDPNDLLVFSIIFGTASCPIMDLDAIIVT